MSWLYGQTWLWYLLAFLVGVLLAWIVLVVPARRRLRALRDDGPVADPGPAAVSGSPDADRRPAVDEAATEQLPAVNPALSTLDTFGGPAGSTRGATAALGAAGPGATGTGAAGPPADDSAAERPAPEDPATRDG